MENSKQNKCVKVEKNRLKGEIENRTDHEKALNQEEIKELYENES